MIYVVKPGIKSSELYVVLAGMGGILYTFFQSHCSVTQQDILALLIAVLSGGYAFLRTSLKSQAQSQPTVTYTQSTTGTPIAVK